jgi:hypothetical protein
VHLEHNRLADLRATEIRPAGPTVCALETLLADVPEAERRRRSAFAVLIPPSISVHQRGISAFAATAKPEVPRYPTNV